MNWVDFCKLSKADMLLHIRKVSGWNGHHHFRIRLWNAQTGVANETIEDVYIDAYNLIREC